MVTAKLISPFVFATLKVISIFVLKPLAIFFGCVSPGRKPQRQVFSRSCSTGKSSTTEASKILEIMDTASQLFLLAFLCTSKSYIKVQDVVKPANNKRNTCTLLQLQFDQSWEN